MFTRDFICSAENGVNGPALANVEEQLNGDSHGIGKEFVRPFPPSRTAFGMRPYRNETDNNPNSPSVSVHIVNVPSPLALQPTR